MKYQYKCYKVTDWVELEGLLNQTQKDVEGNGGEIVNVLHVSETMTTRAAYGVIVKRPVSRISIPENGGESKRLPGRPKKQKVGV